MKNDERMDRRIEELFPYPTDGRSSRAVCNVKREAAKKVFELYVEPMELERRQIEQLGELVFMRGRSPYDIAIECVRRYSDALVIIDELRAKANP